VKFFDRLRGKGRESSLDPKAADPSASGPPAIDFGAVMAALERNLASLEKRQIVPALVRARLADWLRDAAVEPPGPEDVGEWVADLDEEGWRRLALLVEALEVDEVGAAITRLAARQDASSFVKAGMIGPAARTPLLTLSLLRESAVRLEELARVWLFDLGASIQGEAFELSAERLRRLDYGRLLSEAERAKKAAEERMAALREQQEKAERARTRRSKW
jgi:hypothetical protein